MTKFEFKERIRKAKWATEKVSGKKLTKQGLRDVQKMVMEINHIKTLGAEPKEVYRVPSKAEWQASQKKPEDKKLKVDLSKLIGKKF